MEKRAAPRRRYSRLEAVLTVIAFQFHNLWWIAAAAGLYALMIFDVLEDNFGHSAAWTEILLAELGQDFGALNPSMFLALLSVIVPSMVLGSSQQQAQSRGFSLLAAVPGPSVLGHFALALGIGLIFPLVVFLTGTRELLAAGLPVARGPSLAFLLFGLVALWLPLLALANWLAWLITKIPALLLVLLVAIVLSIDLLAKAWVALVGEPGPDFSPWLGYLMRWPLPLPQAVMPETAHAQVVVFPGIPWGWALLGLGLTALFFWGSHRLALGIEFIKPEPWWQKNWWQDFVAGRSRRSQSELTPAATWTAPASKRTSALGALLFSAAPSYGFPVRWWLWLLAGVAVYSYNALALFAISPIDRAIWGFAVAAFTLLAFYLALFATNRLPAVWPLKATPGLPPVGPILAVCVHGLFLSLALCLFASGALLTGVVFLWTYGVTVAVSDLILAGVYLLGALIVPLAGWALLLGAWRGAARRAPTWLMLLTGSVALLTIEAATWWQSWTFLPAWPLVGPELIGISSAGLYSLPQEPFWLSLLVGMGAFLLAARVYEEVEA